MMLYPFAKQRCVLTLALIEKGSKLLDLNINTVKFSGTNEASEFDVESISFDKKVVFRHNLTKLTFNNFDIQPRNTANIEIVLTGKITKLILSFTLPTLLVVLVSSFRKYT